jgi:tetratricopeptide (TPR) repeat protein
MRLFDGLYLYEVVMLALGVFLFVVLVLALVFFMVSIVMMGYPSIKSVQVQKDGVNIEKTARELRENPDKAEVRSKLEQQVSSIGDRPISDPTTLTHLATAQFALGHDKAAEQTVKKALKSDPKAAGARELQDRITAVQKLDSMVAEVEKNPGDTAAKSQLQQTVKEASQQPNANPTALARIAKAQQALGQSEEAAKNLQKALKIDPNLAELKTLKDSIFTSATTKTAPPK